MKKIALFSDGTGNSSSSPQKTNIWRAYQALDRSATSDQIAFYDNGVGTSSFTPTAVLGLAFGWGGCRQRCWISLDLLSRDEAFRRSAKLLHH